METPPFGVPAGTAPADVEKALRADVAMRLRHVCADWPTEAFDALVEDVTATALKYLPPKTR